MSQVKFFQSNQTGAPSITGQAGSLISVLNACLITGFNLNTVSSIIRTDDVATVTVASGHGYRDGDTIRIEGATVDAYNGDWRIKNCTTNTFDYDIEGEPATPAGGTIIARVAPLGWESPFTGDNKAAYRSLEESSNKMYLRVDETSISGGTAANGYLTTSASVQMCERMTDIDTTTGVSQVYWRKSADVSATARSWIIVGDEKRFYLFVCWSLLSNSTCYSPYFFGDVIPFKSGDSYSSVVAGYYQLGTSSNSPQAYIGTDNDIGLCVTSTTSNGIITARSFSQVGGSVFSAFTTGGLSSVQLTSASSQITFPNQSDNGVFVMPAMIWDKSPATLRGRVPGYYFPLHGIPAEIPTVYDGFIINGVSKKLLAIKGHTQTASSFSAVCIDIDGEWD